jgi:hypothetical protein
LKGKAAGSRPALEEEEEEEDRPDALSPDQADAAPARALIVTSP